MSCQLQEDLYKYIHMKNMLIQSESPIHRTHRTRTLCLTREQQSSTERNATLIVKLLRAQKLPGILDDFLLYTHAYIYIYTQHTHTHTEREREREREREMSSWIGVRSRSRGQQSRVQEQMRRHGSQPKEIRNKLRSECHWAAPHWTGRVWVTG